MPGVPSQPAPLPPEAITGEQLITGVQRLPSLWICAEAVEALLANGRCWTDWFVGLVSTDPDEHFPLPGGKFEVVYRAAGLIFHLTFTSLEFGSGQFSLTQIHGILTGVNRTTFTPQEAGTRVTSSLKYEISSSRPGKALDALLIERIIAHNLEMSLRNLKKLIEDCPPSSAIQNPALSL